MSGRKKSEVQSVLVNADMTRKDILDKKMRDIDVLASQCKNDIDQYGASESIETEMESRKDAQALIQQLGKEVAELEKTIRQNPSSHYFDTEFAKAAQILARYNGVSQKLTSVSASLRQKHNRVLQQAQKIEQAEAITNRAREKFSNMQYGNPNKEMENYSLEEACDNILDDSKAHANVMAPLREMESALEGKEYDKAMKKAGILETMVEDMENRFEHAIIKIKENAQITLAIEDVLDGQTEFQTEIVDGKPCRGFRIRTLDGTLECDLTNVFESGDGRTVGLTVNDDDTRCATTASKLVEAVNQAGIQMEVTDWGRAKTQKPSKGKSQSGEIEAEGLTS